MAASLSTSILAPESSFASLILSVKARAALSELSRRFADGRASLLRIRSDRTRLARTGWKPTPPAEMKMIRAAEWSVEKKQLSDDGATFAIDYDLEFGFVPTEAAFSALGNELSRNPESSSRVRLRTLDREESRYLLDGRGVPATFFDLVFVLERHPNALVSIPRIESYLEARFWAELCRTLEGLLELPKHSIRLEAGVETSIGSAEVDEIVFELKETVEAIAYDPRIDLADELRLESGFPSVPKRDFWKNPWSAPETRARYADLLRIAMRRGLRVVSIIPFAPDEGVLPLSLDSLRQKTTFAFRYLRSWFEGEARLEGRDWADFELARALIWTAIRSGFLREENYEAWMEEFGSQPFEPGSAEDAALRTLDPLLRTAIFPESAIAPATRALLELDRTRSVSSRRMA
jgi:malate synthase